MSYTEAEKNTIVTRLQQVERVNSLYAEYATEKQEALSNGGLF